MENLGDNPQVTIKTIYNPNTGKDSIILVYNPQELNHNELVSWLEENATKFYTHLQHEAKGKDITPMPEFIQTLFIDKGTGTVNGTGTVTGTGTGTGNGTGSSLPSAVVPLLDLFNKKSQGMGDNYNKINYWDPI